MLKGLSNVKLLMILGGLVAIYFIIEFTGSKGRSESFRSELVNIDTAKVSAMQITKEGNTVSITRTSRNDWELDLKSGKKVAAKAASVKSALLNLRNIKPSRLASKDPSNWKDYQVDSAGTRIKVFEDGEKALDIILGRFGVRNQNSYHTFVRLDGDDEVYAVDNFMGIAFSTDAASFREQTVFRARKDSIQAIRFNYQDSAFVMARSGNLWTVDGQVADSTSAAEYINKLSYTTSKGFVDDLESLNEPNFTITFEVNSEDDIVLSGYQVDGKGLIYHSSLNPLAYFEDQALTDKFIPSKASLLQ